MAPQRRLVSLDALRGFDMFWIIGGDEIAAAIKQLCPSSPVSSLCEQVSEHVSWAGFHFYDMIFPLFLFIIGATLPFSIGRRLEDGETRSNLIRKILIRVLILFGIGLIYNGALHAEGWDHVRIFGVLQRQAIGYGAASLLYLYLKPRKLVIVAISILLTYWALMALIPVPGFGSGNFSEWGNVANYIDRLILKPGQMYEKYGDPEGLFSMLPAVVTALLGLFAGLWIKSQRPDKEKVLGLLVGGFALVLLGLAWSPLFPIIKKIWTSSYVLVAGGFSSMLLALFFWAVDVKGLRRLFQPAIVIGMNAITIYLMKEIFDFGHVADYFLGGLAKSLPTYSDLILAVGVVLAEWLVLFFFFKKQIFLKV